MNGTSETSRGKVQHELSLRLEPKEESLSTYIDSGVAILVENPEALPPEERSQLRNIPGIESIVDNIWMDPDALEVAHKRHRKAFLVLQVFYVTHHADGILLTAATSIAEMIRGFRPENLMIAVTLREASCTISISNPSHLFIFTTRFHRQYFAIDTVFLGFNKSLIHPQCHSARGFLYYK